MPAGGAADAGSGWLLAAGPALAMGAAAEAEGCEEAVVAWMM